MMEVKGGMIRDLPKYVKENFGEEKYNQWFQAMPKESQDIFNSQILASKWYSFRYGNIEPIKKIVELFHGNDMGKVIDIGKWNAHFLLSGVYKAFVKMGSPLFIVGKAAFIAETFFRPCKLEVVTKEKNHYVMHMKEFPEADNLIENYITGWMIGALEAAGAKNPNVKVNESLVKGDSYTAYEGNWDV